MKKQILPIFLSLLAFSFGTLANANAIQCGKDMDCFINAAKTCSEAEMLYTIVGGVLLFAGTPTLTSRLKIDGVKKGKCSYSGTVVDAQMAFDEKWAEVMIKMIKLSKEKVAAKDMQDMKDMKEQKADSLAFQQYTLGIHLNCELPSSVLVEHLMAMKGNLITNAMEGDAGAQKKLENLPKVQCFSKFPKREVGGRSLEKSSGPTELIDPNAIAWLFFGGIS